MIEARGAKFAYVYSICATKTIVTGNQIHHVLCFDVANSEDEAAGRAAKIARLMFPVENGWRNHFAAEKTISGIDWVGPHDFAKIVPID